MNVYVVMTGKDFSLQEEYSWIEAVFSTREKAEEYISRNKLDHVEIDVCPVDGDEMIYVEMAKDGTAYVDGPTLSPVQDEEFMGFKYPCYAKERVLAWNVRTTDEKEAVKFVNEKRLQVLDIWEDCEAVWEKFNG